MLPSAPYSVYPMNPPNTTTNNNANMESVTTNNNTNHNDIIDNTKSDELTKHAFTQPQTDNYKSPINSNNNTDYHKDDDTNKNNSKYHLLVKPTFPQPQLQLPPTELLYHNQPPYRQQQSPQQHYQYTPQSNIANCYSPLNHLNYPGAAHPIQNNQLNDFPPPINHMVYRNQSQPLPVSSSVINLNSLPLKNPDLNPITTPISVIPMKSSSTDSSGGSILAPISTNTMPIQRLNSYTPPIPSISNIPPPQPYSSHLYQPTPAQINLPHPQLHYYYPQPSPPFQASSKNQNNNTTNYLVDRYQSQYQDSYQYQQQQQQQYPYPNNINYPPMQAQIYAIPSTSPPVPSPIISQSSPNESQSTRVLQNSNCIIGNTNSNGSPNSIIDVEKEEKDVDEKLVSTTPPTSSSLPTKNTNKLVSSKRKRRRYCEIKRIYTCNFENCKKAYGTLNHLNFHIHLQNHGSKRSPSEFKHLKN